MKQLRHGEELPVGTKVWNDTGKRGIVCAPSLYLWTEREVTRNGWSNAKAFKPIPNPKPTPCNPCFVWYDPVIT